MLKWPTNWSQIVPIRDFSRPGMSPAIRYQLWVRLHTSTIKASDIHAWTRWLCRSVEIESGTSAGPFFSLQRLGSAASQAKFTHPCQTDAGRSNHTKNWSFQRFDLPGNGPKLPTATATQPRVSVLMMVGFNRLCHQFGQPLAGFPRYPRSSGRASQTACRSRRKAHSSSNLDSSV